MTKNLKPGLFLICVLFYTYAAQAQTLPDIAWSQCYGGTDFDLGIDIKQTTDGGYIALAFSDCNDDDLQNAPVGNKTWVLKLNATGNIEWQQHLNVNQYTGVLNIQQTADGGYLVGGNKLTKLLPDGTIDWEHPMQSQSAIETYDGGYALLRDYNKITKLDESLVEEWTNDDYSNIIEMSYTGLSSLIQTKDSGFAFCGKWNGFPSEFVRAAWLRKVDKNGVGVISKEWGDFSYAGFTEAMNGKFIVAGTAEHGVSSGNFFQGIAKCDTGVEWKKDMTNFSGNDVIENFDETIIVCGHSGLPPNSGSAAWDGFISKRNAYGDSIVTRTFGGSNEDVFTTIISTNDSGYIAIGYTKSNDGDVSGFHGDRDVWIVKFKKDISLDVTDTYTSKESIKVYPTITSGIVNVQLPEHMKSATIRIFNTIGQEVGSKQTGKDLRTVDISGNAAGMYLLQVNTGKELKSFKLSLSN